jgi:hypothetical protein
MPIYSSVDCAREADWRQEKKLPLAKRFDKEGAKNT